MKVLFRVDSGNKIGIGHLMRCLSLARKLRDFGCECTFVCRDYEGNISSLVRQKGFFVTLLKSDKPFFNQQDSSYNPAVEGPTSLFKFDWQIDAQKTLQAIGSQRFDWLVVDHYQIDNRWENQMRGLCQKILVIDDLANRTHDCDVLLDQNLVCQFESRYSKLVPSHCRNLLGPDYALLGSEYQQYSARIRELPINRILISFGGADNSRLVQLALDACLALDRQDLQIDLVLSRNCEKIDDFRRLALRNSRIQLHESIPSMAGLMSTADLAIGGCGITAWERCYLGLPSLVTTIAENQIPVAQELHRKEIVWWLGHHDQVCRDDLIDALRQIFYHQNYVSWSHNCSQTVDGQGTDRIAALMALSPSSKLHLRAAALADEQLIFEWANEPLVRVNSFNPQKIEPTDHHKWLLSKLCDKKNQRLFVAQLAGSMPIGLVRFSRCSVGWEVHFLVDPNYRGRGIAGYLLRAGIERLVAEVGNCNIIGRVKPTNTASIRVFENLQFEKIVPHLPVDEQRVTGKADTWSSGEMKTVRQACLTFQRHFLATKTECN